jgi:hypothetical protein
MEGHWTKQKPVLLKTTVTKPELLQVLYNSEQKKISGAHEECTDNKNLEEFFIKHLLI